MSARRRKRYLLLSTSVAALFAGGGVPSAWAAPCVHTISSGFDNPAAHTTANVCVQNTSFTGNITNEGTISPSGVALVNGTITGSISSTGVIHGGISLDSHSAIIANGTAIFVAGPTFTGGISNAGTISAAGTGIFAGLGTISTFSGGIANTGTVSAFTNGIVVGGAGAPTATLSAFSGGVSNGGTITTSSRNGIIVGGTATNAFHVFSRSATISTFAGGISNSGAISSAAANGIIVGGKATFNGLVSILNFSGGITNSGAITAGHGIVAGGAAFARQISAASVSISSFSGGISNSGTISALTGSGILVGGGALGSGGAVTISTFSGGIGNSGTIAARLQGIMVGGTALSGGSITISTFAGGISNSGTINHATANGIIVGGKATSGGHVSILSFSGGITNSGAVTAGHGIVVGGFAASGSSVAVSNFSGGISNSSAITAHTGSGILVGGLALGSGAAVTVSTFAGGITNGGKITARTNGIFVGGTAALSGGSVTISTFAGGISNSGTIASRGNGIVVGGQAVGFTSASSVSISNFSGGISNSGTITARSGSGILVGGRAISSGSIVTVSTFGGGITNSGTITARTNGIWVGGSAINASVSISSFSGGISNSGNISAGFAGIWVGGFATGGPVSIGNFSGGISNSGTITAGRVGILIGGASSLPNAISVFSGGITNSGAIFATGPSGAGIAVGSVSTFLGNVSNSGLIAAASGAGIIICGCATFGGGGIVNTGTIMANTGIFATNSSPINIFDSGIIIGTGGTAVDLTGASGGNTFTLGPGYSITGNVLAFAGGNDTFQLGGVGSGSFDLSSVGPSAQYQNFANFNVVSGIWTVFNIFGQSQTWNVDGGILAGTGTLPGINVNNGGTLAPGNIGVPGTFTTVTGDLTFQPGAFYLVQLDPSVASRVNVGGAVTLAGAVEGFLAPGSYSTKTTYDILDPTSITGTFTGFTALNAPGFSGTLTYTPTEVLLNLTAQLGLGGSLNVNQQNVANGINTFFNNGGTLPANFFPFFTLAGGNLANALTRLDGEDATDAHFGAFQLMNQFLNLMLDPWVDGRHGGGGGGAFGFAPDQQANFPPDVALAYAGVLKAPPKATFDDRWTAWGSAFGGTANIAGDPAIGSTNVTASDYGFAAGMDYRASPDTILGFALAGGGTGWNVAQGLGSGRSDAFMAGAYGTTYWGPAYLAGAVAFANHWLTTSRVALSDQLTANFTGQDLAARVEAGYRYAVPIGGAEIGIAPYGALQTQWFHTPTYSETDLSGGGFALTYNAATVNDTRSELGARLDDLVTFDDKPLLLHGRLAWAHDWISGAAQTAAFQALPGSSFSVSGADGPTDSALTTAMAEWHFRPRWSLTAKFDGEFAPGAQTYAGTGVLRYWW